MKYTDGFVFPVLITRSSDALPQASDTGLRHDFVLTVAGFSNVVSAPASTTNVYILGDGRQCCPRPQDQDPTAAVHRTALTKARTF